MKQVDRKKAAQEAFSIIEVKKFGLDPVIERQPDQL
jgi:hypothetical protein